MTLIKLPLLEGPQSNHPQGTESCQQTHEKVWKQITSQLICAGLYIYYVLSACFGFNLLPFLMSYSRSLDYLFEIFQTFLIQAINCIN